VTSIVAIAVAVVLVMRQADAAAPPPRVADSLQVDPAPTTPGLAAPGSGGAPTDRIDPAWAARVSEKAGIPVRALLAYASADLAVDAEQPGCGLGWNTIAAIGSIESVHGSIHGSQLGVDGFPIPAILGPALDGDGFAAIDDTDGGEWDGDARWDRAVGPMQFIPSTWAKWGADGNGDGMADPNQIDDAALGTARYLCAAGNVTGVENWRAAVFSYNHLDSYVDDVASRANRFAAAG
jgi:membrane-bound lytic murein transglycosylase B